MRLADFIEAYTTERSREAIRALLSLAPPTAGCNGTGASSTSPWRT